LIVTGAARNGREATLVAQASTAPKFSFNALPAFALMEASNAKAIATATLLNTPCVPLAATGPMVVASTHLPSHDADAVTVAAIVADTTVVASLAGPIVPDAITAREPISTTPSGPAPISHDTHSLTPIAVALASALEPITQLARSSERSPSHMSAPETVANTRILATNTLIWQQLLVALGLLSAAAVGWRTRQAPARLAVSRSRLAVRSDERPTLRVVPTLQSPDHALDVATLGTAPFVVPLITALPQLPHHPEALSAEAWQGVANEHMQRYELPQAEIAYRGLLAALDSERGAADPLTVNAECQLADCLRDQGRYYAADIHYRRALATKSAAVGEQHPSTADILENHAITLLRQGHAVQAEVLARRALLIRRANPDRQREIAVTVSILAEALRAQGQSLAAESEHRDAWSKFLAVSGQDSLECAASMTSLGALLAERGQFGAAEELLNAGTRTIIEQCGATHPATATSYALLGDLYHRAQASEAAARMHAHALAIRQSVLGERHPDTIESLLQCAVVATAQFKMDEARTMLDRALNAMIDAERVRLGPHSKVRALLETLLAHHDTAPLLANAAE
jgi:tetratricopeptide (TPR) repeat protein